jgi:hypothetical protein
VTTLTSFGEQRAAQVAKIDALVLQRMQRIRRALAAVAPGLGQAPSDLVVLIGPQFDRGIRLRVFTRDEARAMEELSDIVMPPAIPGKILVFGWNHHGLGAFRTFPLGSSFGASAAQRTSDDEIGDDED